MVPKIYSVVAFSALMCVCSCSKSEIPQAQQNVLQEEARLSPHEEVSNDMFISPLDEPENLEELKQLYKQYDAKRRKSSMIRKHHTARVLALDDEEGIDGYILRNTLEANLRVKSPIHILPCNKWEYVYTKINHHRIRQLVSAFTNNRNYVDTKFFFRPLPPSLGMNYLIVADSWESNAEVCIGENPGKTMRFAIIDPPASRWSKGWDLVRCGDGRYTIASDLVQEYKNGEFVPYVWESNHGSEDIRVALEEKGKKAQEFALRPLGRYKIINIRFARTLSKLNSLIRTSNPQEECQEDLTEDEIRYNGRYTPSWEKTSTFTATRTFTNTSSEEVPYDMYFDDKYVVRSAFTPFKTVEFDSLMNEKYASTFTPIIRNDSLVTDISSKDTESNRFNMYPYTTQSREKKLKGVLNLLVRPRSTVTITYTYTSYTVTTYFVAFLQKEGDPSVVYKVVGFWRGDVCAENSKNKHKFKSESLDPNQGEGDDDDDVDFEATTEEALRRSQARSFNPRSTFRSMPRDYKNGVRRIRI